MADFSAAVRPFAEAAIQSVGAEDESIVQQLTEFLDSATCEGTNADEAVDNMFTDGAPANVPEGAFEAFKAEVVSQKDAIEAAYNDSFLA